MRFARSALSYWRSAVLPLLVWLLVAAAAASGLLWQQHDSRQATAQRYELRVALMRDFVTTYTADLIAREGVQARASLTGATVGRAQFAQAVAGFGYPAAVLLDSRGRALQVTPSDPAVIGTDLSSRYAHLRTALREGRPAVSPVVRSAVRGEPVVAFAVPFDSMSGRRVFSGAVAVRDSPLSAYLSSALSLSGAQIQLVDSTGSIVAANRRLDAEIPTLAGENRPLAAAVQQQEHGRYQAGGQWWRYASAPIKGTPWRLSATVSENVLFAAQADNEIAGRAALLGAAAVGLLVVAAIVRARRSRQDLATSEQRFRKVFDDAAIGMTLTDTQGRFVRVNPAACQLFGRTEDDLIGRHYNDITHPDDIEAVRSNGRACLQRRVDGFRLEKRYVHADGHVIEASTTSALLRDHDNEPTFFATQIVDMTERHALERELGQRAHQLQQANANLADFIAMLSHDVQQPLTKIVGLGELLLEDWDVSAPEDKHDDVTRITAAGHRASELVNDVLTLARLDAGAMRARPASLDLAALVRSAVGHHQAGDATPVTVVAPDQICGMVDRKLLELILGNLLANAVKYGEPPIVVTVANRRDHVEIRVADHGEGVPESFVPHLFDRFARADSGVATTTSGTGLGLYLVRQLAQASGLGIRYQPNEPRGANFVVDVPPAPDSPPRPASPGFSRAALKAHGMDVSAADAAHLRD
ncbi:PAS domain S-box protein [Actinoplanes sp. LDG1-06]|uniref:Sensor-like histidine kinase SenX3 n=1 Tax=Paractinoplanes ovalisporus TaxID=2810368 RepID=A0ABS2AHW1_9ACTN|nr:sensor histidine kinase [Actinoplanes ovalisporus]MBM2619426.1 PAS domain S-box protein [Actinoplanes ovalisporus]